MSATNRHDSQDATGNEVRKARRIVGWFLCGALATVLYVLGVFLWTQDIVDRITYALPGGMFTLLFLILAGFHYFTGVRGAKKQNRQ